VDDAEVVACLPDAGGGVEQDARLLGMTPKRGRRSSGGE
jgi:hypothetical protein